ncbi:ParB/RepB/Spo0J family partition protein [Paraferrimonas sp. SM1919]|uniref:ParB/RepB/Spo0J family partition protein n=1 Tax=Paraferrimonas sp. SM1919 TaxID=2662263 RepID=UPI0013D01FC9|nr:ParB/RepB/Spo0J family partition protein [Paraferrimonas sp. SM1919]
MSPQKRGLGKGLDALFSNSQVAASTESNHQSTGNQSGLAIKPIESLVPGKYQPRRDMASEPLEELAESIKKQGLLQPLVIRPISNGKFEIIAGERRWRASQLAGLHDVPCIIKDVDDEAAIAIALIENIQREDLNAIEEAVALQRLLDEFGMTHQQVAEAVGKSRSTVSNLLRLNGLCKDVKLMMEHGDIEMGHGRAILSLDEQQQLEAAQMVIAKDLTVRETEKLVQNLQNPPQKAEPQALDPDVEKLQLKLAETLGTSVAIKHSAKGKGKLVIDYHDLIHLDGILNKISS